MYDFIWMTDIYKTILKLCVSLASKLVCCSVVYQILSLMFQNIRLGSLDSWWPIEDKMLRYCCIYYHKFLICFASSTFHNTGKWNFDRNQCFFIHTQTYTHSACCNIHLNFVLSNNFVLQLFNNFIASTKGEKELVMWEPTQTWEQREWRFTDHF